MQGAQHRLRQWAFNELHSSEGLGAYGIVRRPRFALESHAQSVSPGADTRGPPGGQVRLEVEGLGGGRFYLQDPLYSRSTCRSLHELRNGQRERLHPGRGSLKGAVVQVQEIADLQLVVAYPGGRDA